MIPLSIHQNGEGLGGGAKPCAAFTFPCRNGIAPTWVGFRRGEACLARGVGWNDDDVSFDVRPAQAGLVAAALQARF